jgi:hypothetical protein
LLFPSALLVPEQPRTSAKLSHIVTQQ